MSSVADATRYRSIDVSPHELFERDGVLPLFEKLRREDPVHYCEESRYGPYWSLTAHKDIVEVDNNNAVFSSSFEHGGVVIDDELMRPSAEGFAWTSLVGLDEPLHKKYRHAVQPIASLESVKVLSELTQKRTKDLFDSLPINEEFDWVDKVTIELTSLLLSTIFDLPIADRDKLIHWSNIAGAVEGTDEFVSYEYRNAQMMECLEYFTQRWNERVDAPPKFDLVSMLAHDSFTRNMEPLDYLSQILTLMIGGNDTTRHTMAGSVVAMNHFPDEFRKLKENPKLIDTMSNEILRWQTPIPHQRRTALSDFQLRDKLIRKGDKVIMWYYSGNRDESVFPQGERIDLSRTNVHQHLSFGFGIHRCMGMRLAQMQLRYFWQEILNRYDRIELVGEPVHTRSNQLNGYMKMMVRLKA